MRCLLPLILLILASMSSSVLAQEEARRTIAADQKRQAVLDLAKKLRDSYVLADEAERAAALIEQKLANGEYESRSETVCRSTDHRPSNGDRGQTHTGWRSSVAEHKTKSARRS